MIKARSPLRIAAIAICLCTSLNVAALTQSKQPKPSDSRKPETQPSPPRNEVAVARSKAATIVGEVYDAISTVNPRHLRVALKAKTADAMWDFDEPRARRIMKEAVADLYAYLKELATALKDAKTPPSMGYSPTIGEVSAIVARRDPQLARELLDESLKLSSVSSTSRDPNGRSMLAYGVADADPKLAATIAEIAVESQVDANVVPLLVKLHEKDPAAARRLFAKALETTMRSPDWAVVLMNLATYALPSWGVTAYRYNVGLMGNSGDPESAALVFSAVCNESTRQNQIPVQMVAPTDQAALRSFYATTQLTLAMLPYFERQMPQCANQIRMRANNLLEAMPDATTRERMTSATTDKNFEQLLSEASGLKDKEAQDRAYLRAMLRAMEKGDWDDAMRIVDLFNLEKTRISNKSFVSYRAALASLDKKDIEKALSYTQNVASPADVAQIYSKASLLLAEQKDNIGATSLLRSARDRIEKNSEEPGAGDAILFLATTMSKLDATAAFEFAAAAVGLLNKRLIEVKDLPANNSVRWRWVYSSRLESTMLQLANSDFEESLRVAKLVEDPVPSMNARLAICRSFLERTGKQR